MKYYDKKTCWESTNNYSKGKCDKKDKQDKQDMLESNCEGCICSMLRRAIVGQRFLILLEGTSEFIALGPGQSPQPTEFTFVSFSPNTCCVTFTFTEQGPPPRSQTFIVDCRCICALSPVAV